MTDSRIARLHELVEDVCTSATVAEFARHWGTIGESPTRPTGLRITCDSAELFATLDVRPWDSDGIGIVDVGLRANDQPLAWSAVCEAWTDFEPLDPLPGAGESRMAATWSGKEEGLADALIIVTLDSAEQIVERFRIRRDPG